MSEQPHTPLPQEPGRTPGQAEGTREPAHQDRQEPAPGRTAGQAEGDRATVEEDLRRRGME